MRNDEPDKVRRRLIRIGFVMAIAAVVVTGLTEWLLPRNDHGDGAEAIVVLSSGVLKNGRLDDIGAQRLRRAIAVADSANLPLVTTRVRRLKPRAIFSDSAQKRMIDSLLPARAWSTPPGFARSTRDEAEQVRKTTPFRRVAVVTSRLHTRRACAAFEAIGFEVMCISAGAEPLWKAPYFAAYELAAILKYRVKGWL